MCITVSANTHTHSNFFLPPLPFSKRENCRLDSLLLLLLLLLPRRRNGYHLLTPPYPPKTTSTASSSSFPPPYTRAARAGAATVSQSTGKSAPLVLRWKGREGAAAADGIPPSPPQQVAFKSLFRCCSLATFLPPPPPPLSSAEEEEEEEKRDPSLGSEQVSFLRYVIRQFIAIFIGTVAPRRSLKGGAIGFFFIN